MGQDPSWYVHNKGSDKPALIVELKWNKTGQKAMEQIKDRRYAQAIENYGGEILLVGINYSVKNKKHDCMIERYCK